MASTPLKISLEFARLSDAQEFAKLLKSVGSPDLTVTDLKAHPAMGASELQYILEFLAQISTDIGVGLLGSMLYDALKNGSTFSAESPAMPPSPDSPGIPTSRFSLTIGDKTIACQSPEDLAIALAAARQNATPVDTTAEDGGSSASGSVEIAR